MAYSANDRSERILQSRRFTSDALTAGAEALTDVLDLGAGEIYTDDGLIPTGSSQLPYSGSGQNGGIISGSVVNPAIETDIEVLKFWYRKKLKGAGDGTREVYYFTTSDPATHDDYVTSDSIIETDQEVNFISPKYVDPGLSPSHAGRTTEDENTGYKVVISQGADAGSATVVTDEKYVFDYKTGVLSWVDGYGPGATDFVFATLYQYVGRTLRSQIDDGSIGGAASWEELENVPANLISSSAQIASDISGSWQGQGFISGSQVTENLPTNTLSGSAQIASDISGSTRIYVSGSNSGFDIGQDSTLNFVSGTAGVTVVSNGSDTITIGASTDDVTFNSVTADTLTGTASFSEKVVINKATTSAARPIILSQLATPNGQLGYTSGSNFAAFTYNVSNAELAINGNNANDRLTLSTSSLSVQSGITSYDILNTNATTINFGGAATTLNIGAANGTVTIAGSASIAGDLIVQGAVTSIETENLLVSDQFILLNSGSLNGDGGIIVQTSAGGFGTALFYDDNTKRWGLKGENSALHTATNHVPKQYIVSVSSSAAAPTSDPTDFGTNNDSWYGMMYVDTSDTADGGLYIYLP